MALAMEQTLTGRLINSLAAIFVGVLLNFSAPTIAESAMGATTGTAFFVSSNGEVLTNAHVVENCREIRVGANQASLLARDRVNDLALLSTDLRPSQWANWRLSVQQGEDIVVYGFPLAGVLSSTGNIVTGNVTALAGLGDDSRFLRFLLLSSREIVADLFLIGTAMWLGSLSRRSMHSRLPPSPATSPKMSIFLSRHL